MSGKVALITGANRGIGFGTAQRLGELGFKVLLGARDSKGGAAATKKLKEAGHDAHLVEFTMTNPESVCAAVDEVKNKFKRLDVLINNAALMDFENHVFPMNLARAREEFDVNFFATVDVTDKFLPLLLHTSEAPRIVFVSTPLGTHETVERPQNKYAHPSFTFYKCSKAAINMYAHNLAMWLQNYPEEAGGCSKAMKVNAAYPGYVKTDMSFNSCDAKYTPYEGAETIVLLATLPADGPTGGFWHRGEKLPW